MPPDAGGLWAERLPDAMLARLSSVEESPITAQLTAALVLEDMRKTWMPLPGEQAPARADTVKLPAPITGTEPHEHRTDVPFRVNLIGCGALGTWCSLGLGMAGVRAKLQLYDDDTVAASNLNRQVLFHDAVGRPKADVLAERLNSFFPRLQTQAHRVQVTDGTNGRLRPTDALAACPDNFQARAVLNRVAATQGIALVNGGTAVTGGDAMGYIPGQTVCLDCGMQVNALAAAGIGAHSCQQAPTATDTSNAIIGALMARLLQLSRMGRAVDGIMQYDATLAVDRVGVRPASAACQCHRGKRLKAA